MSKAKKTATDKAREAIPAKKDLLPDGEYFVMPDVKDIPGQEHILNAGIPEEMADTTISSDDEEGIRDGKDILDEDDNEQLNMVTDDDDEGTEDDDINSDKKA